MADLFELTGKEIFRTGTWKGDDFTIDDLDGMVSAFGALDFSPVLKINHDDNEENKRTSLRPALGRVARLYRLGERLMADFADVPRQVYEAVKNKAFNRVSSEIAFDFNRNGQAHKHALVGVALLGADIPAVEGLAALSGLYAAELTDNEPKAYEFDFGTPDPVTMEDIAHLASSVMQRPQKETHAMAKEEPKEPTNNEDAPKGVDMKAYAEQQKQLDDLKESNKVLMASLDEERSTRLLRDAKDTIKSFASIPWEGKEDEDAKAFMAISQKNPEQVPWLIDFFKKFNAIMQTNNAFDEIGSTRFSADAHDEVDAKVKEYRANDPTLSQVKAEALVYQNHPDIARKVRA